MRSHFQVNLVMTIVSEFEAGATRLSDVDRDQWLPVWRVRADIKPDMRMFQGNSCCQVLKFSLILKKGENAALDNYIARVEAIPAVVVLQKSHVRI